MSWPSFCLQNLLSCICSEPGGTKKVTRWLRVPILGRKVFRPEKSSTFRPKSQLMWWDCGYQHDLCLKGDFWINFKRKIKWCCHDLKVIAHKSNPFCCEIKTYYRFFKIRVKHIDFKWPSFQLKNTVWCVLWKYGGIFPSAEISFQPWPPDLQGWKNNVLPVGLPTHKMNSDFSAVKLSSLLSGLERDLYLHSGVL